MRRHLGSRPRRAQAPEQCHRFTSRPHRIRRCRARAGLTCPRAEHRPRRQRSHPPRWHHRTRPRRHRLHTRPWTLRLSACRDELCQGALPLARYPYGRGQSPPCARAGALHRGGGRGASEPRVPLPLPPRLRGQLADHPRTLGLRYGDHRADHRRCCGRSLRQVCESHGSGLPWWPCRQPPCQRGESKGLCL